MADSPLPQRHRKRRERQPQETTESAVDDGSAVPASTDAATNIGCDGVVPEPGPEPRERIDACEYFGVPALVFDEPHVEHVDTAFRDFEPNVTSFAFECAFCCLTLGWCGGHRQVCVPLQTWTIQQMFSYTLVSRA